MKYFLAILFAVRLMAVDSVSVTYNTSTKVATPTNLVFVGPKTATIPASGTDIVNKTALDAAVVAGVANKLDTTNGVAVSLTTATAPTTGNSVVNKTAMAESIAYTQVATVAAMRALDQSKLADGAQVRTAGRTTAGDGGGAVFRYVAGDTTTTNLGTVFSFASGTDRWLWVGGSDLDPKMYGAVGNYNSGAGTGSDDTLAFQSMLTDAFARGVGFRVKTKGTYQLTDSLTIPIGWGGNIDFGGGSLAGYNSEVYMNVTNKPFMWVLDAAHFSIRNLSLYFKPANGWGLSDAVSQPQQNTNAFVFKAVGWFRFMDVANVFASYGSGFLESYADTTLVPARSAGGEFNNNIQNIACRYGLRGIDLDTGSGSSWNNIYLNSSGGGTYTQTAVSALRVRTSIQDESFVRLNVEWSAFTGPMFDLTGSDIHFDSLHVEGIRPRYTTSSIKDLIYLNSGKLKLTNAHIRDIYPDWGSLLTVNIFNLAGGTVTSLELDSCKFETWGSLAGYNFFRYQDNSAGANYIDVFNLDDRAITWATNSPSWYGPSDKPQLASKRFEIRQDFADEPIAFTTYFAGTPTAPTQTTPTIDAGYHPGVLSLYSTTTDFQATLLQATSANVFAGNGVVRYKATFLLPTMPTTNTDYVIFRMGMFSDMSSSPAGTPTDGVGLEMWRNVYGDNSLRLVGRKSNALTSSVLVTSANMLANTWYEVEIILNHDGTQARAFLNPRTSANSANVTSNIPLSTTALKPMVQFVGRGTSPITARQIDLDSLSFTYAPNGIY